jgi:hypothetical protein
MCTYSNPLNNIVILHKLSAFILVIFADCGNRFARVISAAPVRAVSELRAAELASIIVVEHLLNDDLEVLL